MLNVKYLAINKVFDGLVLGHGYLSGRKYIL